LLLLGVDGGTTEAARAADGGRVGGIGIRLLEAPVTRRHDPRARSGVIDHLPPGTTIKRRFQVANTTRKPRHIELYAAAATIDHHTFTVAPDRTPNELTTWTSIDRDAVDVPPHQTRNAQLTIKVPKDASPGERYADIWAATATRSDRQHGVGLVNRVGIRVYLDVGPGGEPASAMQIENLTPARTADGRPEVIAQVRNTGGRALDMTGTVSLSGGPGGRLRAGPYPAVLGVTLAPGDTAPVTVVLDELQNVPWTVKLTLRSGLLKQTVSATVTFPTAGTGRPVATLSSNRLPLATALIGLATALAAGTLILLRRRQSRRRQ
jgi:hypothetical protein